MDRNGWTPFDERDADESACLHGYLLIYHVFRGVIAEAFGARRDTDMKTHWKPMPRKGWIATAERKPTAEDANERGCVLARHMYDGIRETGWRQFECDRYLTHWQPTPPPPDKREIYRNQR